MDIFEPTFAGDMLRVSVILKEGVVQRGFCRDGGFERHLTCPATMSGAQGPPGDPAERVEPSYRGPRPGGAIHNEGRRADP